MLISPQLFIYLYGVSAEMLAHHSTVHNRAQKLFRHVQFSSCVDKGEARLLASLVNLRRSLGLIRCSLLAAGAVDC
jgi:hypothetical protein